MKLNFKKLTLLFMALSGCSGSSLTYADSWTPLVDLRDNTNSFPDGKPSGGWYVTPIHATLMIDGKVLVTGWGRRDPSSCGSGGTRKNGTSFIIDPNNLPNGGTFNIQPINEAPASGTSDVLYCAGHTPLADGRILYTGGARYQDLGGPNQLEVGLNYSRLYSPTSNSFSQISSPMLGGLAGMEGKAWYPTNTRMADGKIMVVGGFSRCCDNNFSNRTLQTFDSMLQDQNQNPWSLISPNDAAPTDMNPGLRDYVHSFLLPKPVVINGLERKMAFMAASGRIIYANTDSGTPNNQRFVTASNGQRAFGAGGWDSTAALVSTGEIMTFGGGGEAGAAQRIDLYQPNNGASRTIDTTIGRRNASSVLLPDGTVLLINGGSDESNFAGDRRRPQVINLDTGSFTTMDPWPNDGLERGYHNFAILLKDGRILLGGGLSAIGGIGCERTDLRIYSPPYLSAGTRPVISNPPAAISLDVGGAAFNLTFSGETLKTSDQGGVVLMAPGSTTHSFDQNQRYIKLAYSRQGNSLIITPPANNQIAPPGDYLLFVIAQTGAPSVGLPVHVQKGQVTSSSSSSASSVNSTVYHLRGTFNGWAEGDIFTPVAGSSTNFEICRNFISGDANGGPRFKVDPNGGWGADAFPATDVPASGWTKIVINGSSRVIVSNLGNLATNCGTTGSVSSSSNSSLAVSSTSSRMSSSSSAVASSSVAATAYHLRGTQNGWAEGDLFTAVAGSTTSFEICRNFLPATGGARFKVDPNGGWGTDSFPAADVPTSGWTKIVINGPARTITSQGKDLAANCGAANSSSSSAQAVSSASDSSLSSSSSSSSVQLSSSSVATSSSLTSTSSSSASVSSAAVQIIMKPKVQVTTGQQVFILGNQTVLSNWKITGGIPCTTTPATTPIWTCQGFSLAPGTVYQYKYIKRDAAGVVVWEGGSNRTRTAPTVTSTYSDTWQ